jgi:hypothetical protein
MTMPRKSRLIARSEVVRLSQNSRTGRNSRNTVSGGSSIARSDGTNPSIRPMSTSRSGGGMCTRGATAAAARITTPSSTVTSSPFTVAAV